MKYGLVVLIMCGWVGCATVEQTSWPVDGGHGVLRVVSQPGMFVPTAQYSWVEECKTKRLVEGRDELSDCVRVTEPILSQQTGVISGLLGPAIFAAGIAGAGIAIGEGMEGDVIQQSQKQQQWQRGYMRKYRK